jgi:hypothetical protein
MICLCVGFSCDRGTDFPPRFCRLATRFGRLPVVMLFTSYPPVIRDSLFDGRGIKEISFFSSQNLMLPAGFRGRRGNQKLSIQLLHVRILQVGQRAGLRLPLLCRLEPGSRAGTVLMKIAGPAGPVGWQLRF